MSNSFTPKKSGALYDLQDFIKKLAVAGARDSFSTVRHYYVTQYIPQIRVSEEAWASRYRFVPEGEDPQPPHNALILDRWNDWLDCRELKDNPYFMGAERVAYFIKRAKLLGSLVDHPYDKAGALLKVFKEYRDEVERAIGRRIKPKSIRLRNDMTDFMLTYANVALSKNDSVILIKGIGSVINQVSETIAPPEVSDIRKARNECEAFVCALYSSSAVDNEKTIRQYTANSEKLSTALKSIPGESLYILDGHSGGTHRQMFGVFTRKPNPAFVIEHYLLTNDKVSWSRQFFVDAVLRKLPEVIKLKHDVRDESESYKESEAERIRQVLRHNQLAPAMDDDAFESLWIAAEKKAWADYRLIRERAFSKYGSSYDAYFIEPSAAELRPNLIDKPHRIFDAPYDKLDAKVQHKLLSRVAPGLGMRYQNLREVQKVLEVSEQETRELFKKAAQDHLAGSKSNLEGQLGNDLSTLLDDFV